MFEKIKREIIEACLSMQQAGLVKGTSGNISVREPESGLVVITPSGIPYDTLTVDDIPVVDVNGNVVDRSTRPTSETPMHTLVYRERRNVGAVVHTHSPYATCFAALNKPLKPVLITAGLLGGEVPVSGFELPGTEELGKEALEDMGKGKVVLLQNHGVLALGANLKEAMSLATYVEDLAHVYHLALQVGIPTTVPADFPTRFREISGPSKGGGI